MPSNQLKSTREPPRHHHLEPASIDVVLGVLSKTRSRRVLYYLRDNDGVAFVEDIVHHLSDPDGTDRERLAIELHHTILPDLASLGAVEYEHETGLVISQRDELVTSVLECVERLEHTRPD